MLPLIRVWGRVAVIDKSRTQAENIAKMLERARGQARRQRSDRHRHARRQSRGARRARRRRAKTPACKRVIITELGPSAGAYCGRGNGRNRILSEPGETELRTGARSMKFGIFYEHSVAETVEPPVGAARLSPGARADRARRRTRLRPGLGSRASLPRGVFALLRARGFSCGRRGAHQAHPHRTGHRGMPPADESSGAHCGARGGARPDLQRAPRIRHRPFRDLDRGRRASESIPTTPRKCGTR